MPNETEKVRDHCFFSGPVRGGTICYAAIQDDNGTVRTCGREASEHSHFNHDFEMARWGSAKKADQC